MVWIFLACRASGALFFLHTLKGRDFGLAFDFSE